MRALIVVDCQNDFTEGGALAVEGGDACCSRITDYVAENHELYGVILATRDWHPADWDQVGFEHFSHEPDYVDTWPPHCITDTAGAEFDTNLKIVFDRTHIFYKGQKEAAYSGFEGVNGNGVNLAAFLRDAGVDRIDVCGIAWDYCVKATVLDGVKEGFTVDVIKPLTASVHPENDDAVMNEFHAAHVMVWAKV